MSSIAAVLLCFPGNAQESEIHPCQQQMTACTRLNLDRVRAEDILRSLDDRGFWLGEHARVEGDLMRRAKNAQSAFAFSCRYCCFTGEVSLQGPLLASRIVLDGSEFLNPVSISEADVEQRFSLVGATFRQPVTIDGVNAAALMNLGSSCFFGSLDISGTVAARGLNISRSEFGGAVRQMSDEYFGVADFSRCEFHREIDATDWVVEGALSFSGAALGGNTRISESELLRGVSFSRVDLRPGAALDLVNTYVRGPIILSDVAAGVCDECLSLTGTSFSSIEGAPFDTVQRILRLDPIANTLGNVNRNIRDRITAYRLLESGFRSQGLNVDADKAERVRHREEARLGGRLGYLQWWTLEHFSGYGQHLWRLAMPTATVVFVFAALLWLLAGDSYRGLSPTQYVRWRIGKNSLSDFRRREQEQGADGLSLLAAIWASVCAYLQIETRWGGSQEKGRIIHRLLTIERVLGFIAMLFTSALAGAYITR